MASIMTRNVPVLALVYSTDLLPEPGDLPALDLGALLRGGTVRVEAARPTCPREYRGETPIHGQGAVARWLALHERARQLRAALRTGDGVGECQARRAILSLFLYEHLLLPVTRRQARSALWRRERVAPLPDFAERARWACCRCPQCQPALHAPHPRPVVLPSSLADVLPRSA